MCGTFLLGGMLLGGCGKQTQATPTRKVNHNYVAKTHKNKIYSVDIKDVQEDDMHDWVVKGDTKAPNGAKIIITASNPNNRNYGDNNSESKALASWPKVDDKKAVALTDPIGLSDATTEKEGQKIKVLVFAVTNYASDWDSIEIPKRIVNKAKDNIKPYTLIVTKGQEKYSASLNDDNSNSSSSNNTDENTEQKTADNLPKNVLYGYRDDSNSKEKDTTGYEIEDRDYVSFWTDDNNIITSMKLDFRDVPLMANDPDNNEYITDNTAEDATQSQNLGNDKYIYHSNKYNLDYQVNFQKNSDGDISMITIYPKQ